MPRLARALVRLLSDEFDLRLNPLYVGRTSARAKRNWSGYDARAKNQVQRTKNTALQFQKIRQQPHPVGRQDRFGMELHAFNS